MATRRRSGKGRPARGASGGRRRGRAQGGRRSHSSGARQARAAESARRVRVQAHGEAEGGAATSPTGTTAAVPHLSAEARENAREPAGPGAAHRAHGSDRRIEAAELARRIEAAELARRIEAEVGKAELTFRSGPGAAPERLRAHRAEVEEDARRREGPADTPGLLDLGLELAVGALRLVRAVAMAPLRLAVAVVRRGVASA